MGGEPTFVSIDDLDAPEWNTGAVGGDKERARRRPDQPPARPLRAGRLPAFRPGQMVSRREPAALGLFALLAQGRRADLARPGADRRRRERRPRRPTSTREGVAGDIAERLGLGPRLRAAGLRGRELLAGARGRAAGQRRSARSQARRPGGARAHGARVRARPRPADRLRAADPALERGGRARLAQRALAAAARQALSRAGRLAAGPAAADQSLPWVAAERLSASLRRSIPSTPREPLPPRGAFPRSSTAREIAGAERAVLRRATPVRTALSVELRDGVLCVFMPPTERLEDYLELLAAVEAIAEERMTPVRIEGYTPPLDPRINVIKVTPDPGVIEVNVHPAAFLARGGGDTTALYEEARQARLGTDKFMVDGRHTGTGGGNHVVLGGATPADSPFLRRPDLLASLVLYWQRHPSLSLSVLRPVHRPDQPGAAPRRGARRPALRAGDRARAGARRPGADRAAVARRPAVPQPAGRRHRQHASRRNLHRQALFARQRRPAGSASSSSARSRCRRTRA